MRPSPLLHARVPEPGQSEAKVPRCMLRALALLASVALCAAACGDTPASPTTEERVASAAPIHEVHTPDVLLPGSAIHVSLGVGALRRDTAALEVSVEGAVLARLTPLAPLEFAASDALIEALIDGQTQTSVGREVTLVLDDGRARTTPFHTTWRSARQVPLALNAVSNAPTYYGQHVVLQGAGFVTPNEARVSARLQGTFTPSEGEPEDLDVSIPVRPVEDGARDRGLFTLPARLGGLRAGQVAGTLTLSAEYADDHTLETPPLAFAFTLLPPEIFRPLADTLWLGEALRLSGGGFLDEPGITTILQLSGTFTGPQGSAAIEHIELILDQAHGSEGRFFMRAIPRDDRLVSEVFGQTRGSFDGSARLSVTDGTRLLQGTEAPLAFTLRGVRQVVWLRMLPDFYESLDRFGLGAAAGNIEALVYERIAALFDGWALELRLQEPSDVEPNHVTRIDIGGPDPNGIGLFGFDNTPGKDVNNLRLFDVIGGANFDTQQDGYPGYGGVFIESMLWWSSHPPAPEGAAAANATRPQHAPQGDPHFDALFDPLFARPATPAELSGQGDPARVEQVNAAARALANAIGETAAHELGHSLGLAQPNAEGVFHNNGDTPGCLMDHGEDRPFGERAALPGFTPTRWCGDAPAYLDSILPLY